MWVHLSPSLVHRPFILMAAIQVKRFRSARLIRLGDYLSNESSGHVGNCGCLVQIFDDGITGVIKFRGLLVCVVAS